MADNQAPATKADIQMLMDSIGNLYDANKRWKDELKQEMNEVNAHWKDELKEHFDLAVEHFHDEFNSAHREKISLLDDRVKDHEERLCTVEAQLAV
jgi:gas vesicle protein